MKTPVFKDRVKVYLKAGDGGDGCNSFRREKFVPFGGPSGGDGGNGGSIYFVADEQCDSLLDLYFRPHQKAETGVKGMGKDCHGRNGKDLMVKVPRGTIVMDEVSGKLIGEVLKDGEKLRVAKGGRGGLGNKHFKTSSNQAPTETTPGTPGEQLTVWLELKTIAQVGLVGYPNAGKSTLLSKLTHAHPKIGAYPFTTLNPVIGTLVYEDYTKIRMADIPGLIDGAHEGAGLGHHFLRHIERTLFLIFVLDMGAEDGSEPWEVYASLKDELKSYNEELADRPYIVVANKMDVPGSSEKLAEFIQHTGETPFEICAEIGEGIDELKPIIRKNVDELTLPDWA